MASTEANRRYRDIDLNFAPHPVTGDVSKKLGEDAVIQSVKNLILTEFYDVPFHPEIGCQVHGLLFENITSITAGLVKDSIRDVIVNYEPRAEILDLTVDTDETEKGYIVFLKFKILGTLEPIDVSFFLTRSR